MTETPYAWVIEWDEPRQELNGMSHVFTKSEGFAIKQKSEGNRVIPLFAGEPM